MNSIEDQLLTVLNNGRDLQRYRTMTFSLLLGYKKNWKVYNFSCYY
jgi:hypothetical protein